LSLIFNLIIWIIKNLSQYYVFNGLLCSLVERYQHSWGCWCLHPPTCLYLYTVPNYTASHRRRP
jgi:hypothetical protein